MKKFAVLCLLMFAVTHSHGQSYNDMFTTYKSVPTPKSTPVAPRRKNPTTIAPQNRASDTNPQYVKTVKGVNIKDGKTRTIKMQVGIDIILEKVVIMAVWDGYSWRPFEFLYASDIKNNAPEEIKQLFDFEVNIPGIGRVYF